MRSSPLRSIPSVEKVLQHLGETGLPRAVVVDLVRRELASRRKARSVPPTEAILDALRRQIAAVERSRIQPVINGTGVVIHTNLGRSPLSTAAVKALTEVAGNYSNLELDLTTGDRGPRGGHLEHHIALLCGAEAATVVNNCAAGLVLILRHFAAGRRCEVIISRGELVQIGGGFRIPEILEASGARLREVGTTNQTSIRDYEEAIGPETAMILKVHPSNFFMDGFVQSPKTEEIASLTRKKRLPLVEDLGSGALLETENIAAIGHEPTAREVLKRGVDLVCFSGDKLLGGPQAGIIAGRGRLVSALKREPFFRALRCDKLILAALQATIDGHLRRVAAVPEIPVLRLLHTPLADLERRGRELMTALAPLGLDVQSCAVNSQVGGGTLPRSAVASIALSIRPDGLSLKEFSARLRRQTPPVVGYIAGGSFKLDLRTIFPHQDSAVVDAIRTALGR